MISPLHENVELVKCDIVQFGEENAIEAMENSLNFLLTPIKEFPISTIGANRSVL